MSSSVLPPLLFEVRHVQFFLLLSSASTTNSELQWGYMSAKWVHLSNEKIPKHNIEENY